MAPSSFWPFTIPHNSVSVSAPAANHNINMLMPMYSFRNRASSSSRSRNCIDHWPSARGSLGPVSSVFKDDFRPLASIFQLSSHTDMCCKTFSLLHMFDRPHLTVMVTTPPAQDPPLTASFGASAKFCYPVQPSIFNHSGRRLNIPTEVLPRLPHIRRICLLPSPASTFGSNSDLTYSSKSHHPLRQTPW